MSVDRQLSRAGGPRSLCNAAAGLETHGAWQGRRAQGLGSTEDHPPHHGSSSTALGVDARAAGHPTPWGRLVSSARVWCTSPPVGQRGRMPQHRQRKVPWGTPAAGRTPHCRAAHPGADGAKTRRPAVPFGQLCLELGLVSAAQLGSILSQHGRRLFLGEWLALTGVITPGQLRAALRQRTQGSQKHPLGALLIAQGWLTDTTLQQALTQQAQLTEKTISPCFQKFGALLTNQCLPPQDLLAAIVEAQDAAVPWTRCSWSTIRSRNRKWLCLKRLTSAPLSPRREAAAHGRPAPRHQSWPSEDHHAGAAAGGAPGGYSD